MICEGKKDVLEKIDNYWSEAIESTRLVSRVGPISEGTDRFQLDPAHGCSIHCEDEDDARNARLGEMPILGAEVRHR